MDSRSPVPIHADVSRRRALGLLGAGAAGAAVALLNADAARAGHAGDNVLHLGEVNFPPPASSLAGRTDISTDIDDFAVHIDNVRTGGNAGGLYVTCQGGKPGIEVDVLDGPGVAVQGVSGCCENFGTGPATGVQGITGNGVGVQGIAGSGGVAVQAITDAPDGAALHVVGRTDIGGTVGISADVDQFVLGLHNPNGGETAGGIYVTSRGGKPGIEVDVLDGPGVALQGVAGCCEGFGQGEAIGVQGITGTGVGVDAIATAHGLALRVDGRAAFTTAGVGVVPRGEQSVFVPDERVTDLSHVTVTFTSDPGGRRLHWVERHPGSGFTAHMAPAPRSLRPATDFSYLVVEPGA